MLLRLDIRRKITFIVTDLWPEWKTVWILISWLHVKPADLDLHCFPTRVHQSSAWQSLKTQQKYQSTTEACNLTHVLIYTQSKRFTLKANDYTAFCCINIIITVCSLNLHLNNLIFKCKLQHYMYVPLSQKMELGFLV